MIRPFRCNVEVQIDDRDRGSSRDRVEKALCREFGNGRIIEERSFIRENWTKRLARELGVE